MKLDNKKNINFIKRPAAACIRNNYKSIYEEELKSLFHFFFFFSGSERLLYYFSKYDQVIKHKNVLFFKSLHDNFSALSHIHNLNREKDTVTVATF